MLGEFTKGLIRRNPIFVLMVGLCPALATSNTIKNAFAMGLAATSVLLCSNVIISLIRSFIPRGVRLGCYIVVIASFVTIVELWMKALFRPEVSEALGIFIPLIVVNCTIIYRAEDFASKNGVWASALDGLGMGVGFTCALMVVAVFREGLGTGTLLGLKWSTIYAPAAVMAQAPGAFLTIGLMLGLFRMLGRRRKSKELG